MRLFAFGSNGSGQLGIGHEDDVSTPTQCLFEQPEASATSQTNTIKYTSLNERIIKIAAGGNHTLILASTGTIYAAGCNTDGRCGPPIQPNDPAPNILHFRQLLLQDPISGAPIFTFSHVSATWEGTIAVASVRSGPSATEDRVYVFGSSPKGELGMGSITSAVGACIPSFPPAGVKITALASGMAHSAAVLSNGDVYGWGGARKGQLGDENRGARVAYSPVRISVPFFAEAVACGREFTVVSGRGQFVVLGDSGNRWGILSVPESLSLRGLRGCEGYVPDEQGLGVCGGLIRESNTCVAASWHGVYVHAVPELPLEVTLDKTECAGSRSDERTDPAFDLSGSLVAWGRNDRGQLPPPDLPTPAKLAVGSEHALALLKDGRVVAFGWGEHGNCGPDIDSLGNVSGNYNVIPLLEGVSTDKEVIGVGAGCATSWIIVT